MRVSTSSDSSSQPSTTPTNSWGKAFRALAAVLRSPRTKICVALILGSVGIFLRLLLWLHWIQLRHPVVELMLFGGAVVAAAFVLAWASEALQMDISSGLATAILALIAVMPEYSVDFIFAWDAAHDPSYAQYAAANMTGANRLLIGVGWACVVLLHLAYVRYRAKHPIYDDRRVAVLLLPSQTLDLFVLSVATLWALVIPLTHQISPWHGAGMIVIYIYYMWRLRNADSKEPELEGVAKYLADFPKTKRRLAVTLLLAVAAGVLLCSAEPFAKALLHTGDSFRINKFLLVQCLAPLASEAPELLVALVFAWRGHAQLGLAALVSSKVNQWTLLVGTLPFVYSASLREWASLPMDAHQTEEFVLTATQGLMGIAMLSNGRLERWEAVLLMFLYFIQLPFQQTSIRYGMSILYVVIAMVLFYRGRHVIRRQLVALFQSPSMLPT